MNDFKTNQKHWLHERKWQQARSNNIDKKIKSLVFTIFYKKCHKRKVILMVRVFLSWKLFSIYHQFRVGKLGKFMYYLKKISSLGLMDKVRFTDKVRERLLIILNAAIIKKPYQFHMKCFLIEVFGLIEKTYPSL